MAAQLSHGAMMASAGGSFFVGKQIGATFPARLARRFATLGRSACRRPKMAAGRGLSARFGLACGRCFVA
jgi:hypothetical protein